jgi:ethanolamine utilization protein EutN
MIKATVLGPVWATKRIDNFPAGALLEVQQDGTHQRYVALDQLGSGPGDHVLVALGAAVSQHLPGTTPTDALIIGVIDPGTNQNPTQPNPRKANSHE